MNLKRLSPEEMKIAKERNRKEYQKEVDHFIETENKTSIARFKTIPERHQRTWLLSYYGKASKTQAIKAKCCECCGYENIATEVGDCIIRDCPLWCYRPYQKK